MPRRQRVSPNVGSRAGVVSFFHGAIHARDALLLILSLPAGALAQAEKKPEPTVQYEKKTVIDFEDDTIQGDLTRPDGEYVRPASASRTPT